VYEASCQQNFSGYSVVSNSNNPKRVLTLASQNPNRPEAYNGDEELTTYFKIFPNPAHNTLNVEMLSEAKSVSGVQLIIYDVTGREVMKEEIHSQLSTFNCQLTAGIYLVKVSDGERLYTQKLVVE
jgi:hypothetical protein